MTRITAPAGREGHCHDMAPTITHDETLDRISFNAISATFESLGRVVAFVDSGFRIVQASPALRGLFAASDIEGRSIGEFLLLDSLMDCIRSGRRCEGRCDLMTGGVLRPVHVWAGKLAEHAVGGESRYVLAIDLADVETSEAGAADAEKILHALESNRWRRSAAARSLGISRATLWRRMRDLGIL